jgi:hypothetical protein
MDEIKKLKMMLEGKSPIDMGSVAQGPGNQAINEKIIYRDRDVGNK